MIARSAILLLLASQALAAYTVGELLMRIFPEPGNELVSAPAFVSVAFIAFLAPAALDWFAVGSGKRALAVGVIGLLALYGALRLQYAHDLALWDFSWAYDFVVASGEAQDLSGEAQDLIAPVVFSSLLLALTWAWAAWRARGGPWLENAPRTMVIPFAAVTLALLIAVGSEQAELVTRGGVVFYGVALAALACSQLSQSGSTIGGVRSGGVTAVMLAGTGAFAVIGVLLVGVLLDPLVDSLSTPAQAIGRALIWFVAWIIFFPLAWVLINIYEFILFLFSLLGGGESEPLVPAEAATQEATGGAQGGEETAAGRVARYVMAGGAIFLGVAVVAGLIFILAFLRRRAEAAGAGAPESERVGAFGEDLRDALSGLFRRDRRREPSGEGAVRLYLDVLESARRAGAERSQAQTAHEFAPVLLGALRRDVTDEITTAFEYARYAGRPPDESALADLRRRWEARD